MASPGKPRPIKERFDAAVGVIKSLPSEGPFQPSNTTKLRFYALYKQVNNGPCDIPKPGFWDAVGRAKWEAWTVCGQMSKEVAMQMYVEELQRLVETMPQTTEVEQFLGAIGPFYEEASDEESDSKQPPPATNKPIPQVTVETSSGQASSKNGQLVNGEVLSVSNQAPPKLTNPNTAPAEEEGSESGEESEGGESGEESDSSVDFKDSFQELGSNQTDWPQNPPTKRTITSSTPSNETRQTGPSSRTSTSLIRDQGRQRVSPVSRPPRTVTFAGSGEREAVHTGTSPGLSSGGGTIQLSSPDSHLLALDTVSSEITRLQTNIQSMLQQLNTLALAVNGLTRMFGQPGGGRGQPETAGTSTAQQLVPRLVTRRGRFLTLCIRAGPILVAWPIVVNIIMSFIIRRYMKSHDGSEPFPSWIWGLLSVLQAAFTLVIASKLYR